MTARARNAASLARAASAENIRVFGLAVPALVLLSVALMLPLLVMTYQSFINADGQFTFEHYERLWQQAVYMKVFRITFTVSILTTLIVALIGYPLAYLISQMPQRLANIALIGVMLPFWTSILVRTYAWLVLLQNRGLINTALINAGIIDAPLRLVHNMTGTLIGMVHVMLPFFVLPLYATMKSIDPDLMSAASNLGARPARAFRDIYFPLSRPGMFAGLLIVFVLCLGFYVTPAVLGGGRIIMVAMRIDDNVRLYSSWGAASALGITLLALTLGLLALARLVSRSKARG